MSEIRLVSSIQFEDFSTIVAKEQSHRIDKLPLSIQYEIADGLFEVQAESSTTSVSLTTLRASLAGRLVLIRFDYHNGHYRSMPKHLFSRNRGTDSETEPLRIVGIATFPSWGVSYRIAGGGWDIDVSEKGLKASLHGRMLLAGFKYRKYVKFQLKKYSRQDVWYGM